MSRIGSQKSEVRRNLKVYTPSSVQKQKITETLLKSGMTHEEIKEAFKLYKIERKIVYKNGKKRRRSKTGYFG